MMTRKVQVVSAGMVLLAGPFVSSVSDAAASTAQTVARPPGAAAPRAPSRQPPEAYVLGFLDVANRGDIDGGRLAQAKAQDPQVREYGRRMVEEHQSMLRNGNDAAARLRVIPTLDSESVTASMDQKKAIERLRKESGAAFDRAYIQHEIRTHREVLQKLKEAERTARQPALKHILLETRPVVESHLEAALSIENALKGPSQPLPADDGASGSRKE